MIYIDIDIHNNPLVLAFIHRSLKEEPFKDWYIEPNANTPNPHWIDYPCQTARLFRFDLEKHRFQWQSMDSKADVVDSWHINNISDAHELIQFILDNSHLFVTSTSEQLLSEIDTPQPHEERPEKSVPCQPSHSFTPFPSIEHVDVSGLMDMLKPVKPMTEPGMITVPIEYKHEYTPNPCKESSLQTSPEYNISANIVDKLKKLAMKSNAPILLTTQQTPKKKISDPDWKSPWLSEDFSTFTIPKFKDGELNEMYKKFLSLFSSTAIK